MMPLFRSLRPRHWIKNLVVFAGLGFSGRLRVIEDLERVTFLFVLFCLVASAVYLVNDVFDIERDRLHPTKRHRPIASGRIAPRLALAAAAVLAAAGLAGGAVLGLPALGALAGYLLLQALYSVHLKHVVILDVFCIGAGFLLRVLAGVWTADVVLSPWLVACSVQLALFLALCKRKAETATLQAGSIAQRPALDEYRGPVTDVMVSVLASATLVTYTLYTLLPGEQLSSAVPGLDSRAGTPGMVWTVPLVLYGVLRYLYLVYRQDKGERPEVTVMTDKPLLGCLVLYLLVVVAIIYAAPAAGV